ncbi:helix-turn-helix domain-containing protein [Alicyclobacillaceae bacterium I2511]|nr:helix-turn-helix domain-containing protein [Alicyclobacillaceae bacterium I2511]
MDVQQVADHFQVHPSTVRRWIQRGKLRATRIEDPRGAHYRIEMADLNLLDSYRPVRNMPLQSLTEVAASRETSAEATAPAQPMESLAVMLQTALTHQSVLQQHLLQELQSLREDMQTLLTVVTAAKELADLQEERYVKQRDQQLVQAMQTLQRNKQPRRSRLWNRG